jgi:hypothetical protein
MRARTVFVILVSAALAGSFANRALAGLRVSNRTDQNIEVSVTFIDWGTDSFVNDTGWRVLKPGESYDPDKGYFGLGKIYFLTARYSGGTRHGKMLPIRTWKKYEAGKYSTASAHAYFDPESKKFRQLNSASVVEDIKKGNWSQLEQQWPGIRMTSPVAKIIPLSDTYGSFQIDLYQDRFVAKIWKQR